MITLVNTTRQPILLPDLSESGMRQQIGKHLPIVPWTTMGQVSVKTGRNYVLERPIYLAYRKIGPSYAQPDQMAKEPKSDFCYS